VKSTMINSIVLGEGLPGLPAGWNASLSPFPCLER